MKNLFLFTGIAIASSAFPIALALLLYPFQQVALYAGLIWSGVILELIAVIIYRLHNDHN